MAALNKLEIAHIFEIYKSIKDIQNALQMKKRYPQKCFLEKIGIHKNKLFKLLNTSALNENVLLEVDTNKWITIRKVSSNLRISRHVS